MRIAKVVLISVFLVALSGVALADEQDDIRALIDEYCRLESTGELTEQAAKLISPDRVFISNGRRLTDQAANTKGQQAAQDRNQKIDPGAQLIVVAVDPIIRVYGDAAVASFYRHWQRIWSPEFIKEQGADAPPTWFSDIVTLVLAKEGENWKIVHTHNSPYRP